jgi:periplasmic copper chaperone A
VIPPPRHHDHKENDMRLTTLAALGAAAALLAPAAAGAHVTVQPREMPAGGFARMDVRVPNERDDEGTTRVAVKMPPGFYSASYEPEPGWTVKVTRRKLAEPAELHGEPVTEEIDTITWTGDGKRGIVRPGQFKDFGISVAVPDKAGTELKFPATQASESGEVVRWIGPEDAEEPAPIVTLTAAGGHEGVAAEPAEASAAPPATGGVTEGDLDDKASKNLAIGALIVGVLGLLAGAAGLSAARRRTA